MKRFLIGLVAVLVILASMYLAFHKPVEKGEKLATDVSEALGQRAAVEVSQMLGNKGQVAIIGLEIKPGQAPSYVAAVDTFTSTLKKHGVAVARTKELHGGLSLLMVAPGVPPEDYSEIMDKEPKVDAVITFVGLPKMSSDELQKYQASHPPLVVLDIFGVVKNPELPALIEDKAIALAILARNGAEVEAMKDEPKVFEHYYKILRSSAAKP